MKRPRRMTRGRRTVFFVDLGYDGWDGYGCAEYTRTEIIVASRRQAKKAIQYIRVRCGRLHYAEIKPAVQDDLFYTGWTVQRRTGRLRALGL